MLWCTPYQTGLRQYQAVSWSMQANAPALRLARLPNYASESAFAKCLILWHTRSCDSLAHKQKFPGREGPIINGAPILSNA